MDVTTKCLIEQNMQRQPAVNGVINIFKQSCPEFHNIKAAC